MEKLPIKIINGKPCVEIYVCKASKTIPNLRVQTRRLLKKDISIGTYKRAKKEIEEEMMKKLIKLESKGKYWCDLCELWRVEMLNNQLSNLSPETVQDNYNALKTWGKHFWNKHVEDIKTSDIREMIRFMKDSGKSLGFISRVKYAFNATFRWGVEENIIKNSDRSPAEGISISKKKEIKRADILKREEVNKLLIAAKNLENPWYPIWFLALNTGMRNGELHALRFEDLDFSANDGQGNIIVRRSYNTRRREDKCTKSGDLRNVPMNSAIKELLLSLKNNCNGRVHVLPRLNEWDRGDQSKILRSFCKSIGITNIHFHALRATFATHMLQLNISPATVMKIGGWKDMDTMGIYLRLSGVDEKGATECLTTLMPVDAINNVLEFNKIP